MTLFVTYAVGSVSLQDLGRTGHMHEGVPPGGAAVRSQLIAANRRAGNRDDAVALEICGEVVVYTQTHVELATHEVTHVLKPGQEARIDGPGWKYLAVRGGFVAPRVLGGCGALPDVRIRKGDQLALAHEPRLDSTRAPEPLVARRIRVVPGPDLDAFASDALDVLCSEPYRTWMIARTGLRFRGGAKIPRVPGYRERSRPMVRGAIEVPDDGSPILLGPDHPTTGGYPVLAVVAEADLDRAFAFPDVVFYTA